MANFFEKLLRMGEGKIVKNLQAIAEEINDLEPEFEKLTDEELKAKTPEFIERLEKGEELDDLLLEAFATVREASKRTLGQRHFDVQLMGGVALHQGNIAEMKTGEGKTLVSTLPVYLNALTKKGVHVVTVNDYLAKYQSDLMGRIYRFLGLSVGCIVNGQTPEVRKKQYDADITYGTNNEFGFDYLRDNMAWSKETLVQRGHHFAIVDEVDSILIDEARTPLIISGKAEGDLIKWYKQFAVIAKQLVRVKDEDIQDHKLDILKTAEEKKAKSKNVGDYEVDEKKRTVGLTDAGIEKIERILGIDNLYESVNTNLIGFAQNAIKAKELFQLDKDYIIENGEVKIVDEHTGRVLEGRRYSEGMHQAIEAKEKVQIKEENQTFATITLQNYFRMYEKLAGMTGTAETEAAEFGGTYKLDVIPIPTNKEMIRIDHEDLVYRTEKGKYKSMVEDITERHKKGQPILVGTASVEKSEVISKLLNQAKIPHNVLNAKNHKFEASIVAQAGRKGAVTVATNMAGRGTDIMLGGNSEFIAIEQMEKDGYNPELEPEKYEKAWPKYLEKAQHQVEKEHDEVAELGGLYVLGTERHESRRIDNQLRGRSGRQGDPGESRFFISMQDDLMRLFNSSMAERMMSLANFPEDQPLEAKIVSKSILRAQTQVESRNFEIRKNVLQYDDVMNKQREVIYEQRQKVLDQIDLKEQIELYIEEIFGDIVNEGEKSDWDKEDVEKVYNEVKNFYPFDYDLVGECEKLGFGQITTEMVKHLVIEEVNRYYQEREDLLGSEAMRKLERQVILSILDRKWREHLYEVDYLKEGISLRSFAQKDPLVEYRSETSLMFNVMNYNIRKDSLKFLLNFQFRKLTPEEIKEQEKRREQLQREQQKKLKETESTNEQDIEDNLNSPEIEKLEEDDKSKSSQKSIQKNESKNQAGNVEAAIKQSSANAGPRAEALVKDQQPRKFNPNANQLRKAESDGVVYHGTKPNEECPCGSGKKYKLCHGLNEVARNPKGQKGKKSKKR